MLDTPFGGMSAARSVGQEDDETSLFGMDDLVTDDDATSRPGAPAARAFSKAVCIPFDAGLNKAPSPPSALEGQVQQLLSEATAAAAPLDLPALAARMRRAGLAAEVLSPAPPRSAAPLTTRSIDAPFMVVMQGADAASTSAPSSLVLVDPSLREHLAVAPATPAYRRALAAAVPEVFVGGRARLAELVTHMATHIAANFRDQGVALPPWRGRQALLNRWAVVEALFEARALAAAAAAALGSSFRRVADEVPADAVPLRDQDAELTSGVVVAGKLVAAAAASAGKSDPWVSVVGFAVGAGAVGVEPWRGAAAGAFGARAPRASTDASSVSSGMEELVFGESPVSMLRGGLGAAGGQVVKA